VLSRTSFCAPTAVPAALHRAEVLVVPTWNCNLRCSYCFLQEADLDADGSRMSTRTAQRVVDALDEGLADHETISVHLYGGEPLTQTDTIRTMVERARTKAPGRFSFAVTTNGTCGSDETLELLRDGQFQVILSIDGPAEIHDACRRTADGSGTQAVVLDFLQALKDRTDCWVRGSSVVRRGWRLRDAVDYLLTLPVDRVKAQAVRVPADSPHALTPAEWEVYYRDLEEIGRRVAARLDAGQSPRDDRFSSRVLQLLMGKARDHFCGAGASTFGILPDGEVRACALLDDSDSVLGHIEDDPDTWVREGARWRSERPVWEECSSCTALPLCGGGCPAMLAVCGAGECEVVRKNCAVATSIFDRFRETPDALLALADIEWSGP